MVRSSSISSAFFESTLEKFTRTGGMLSEYALLRDRVATAADVLATARAALAVFCATSSRGATAFWAGAAKACADSLFAQPKSKGVAISGMNSLVFIILTFRDYWLAAAAT